MLRLIASENYASPAVLAALGSHDERQVRGGLPGPPVLRRLRVRRRRREPGDRPGEGAVRRRPRERPAARRRARRTWPCTARSSNPKDADQKVLGLVLAHGGHLTHGSPVNVSRQVVLRSSATRWTRDTETHRHGPRPRPGARAPAADHPGRVHRLPADHRLRRRSGRSPTRWARSSWSTRRTSSGWSPAARTRRRSRTPTSSRSRRTRPCAAPGARSSCAGRSTRRRSTRPCSR